jgi:hypothetical protein
MINPNENNNSTIKDDSCIVVTRPVLDQQGSSTLKTTQINNCSKPVHALCRTKAEPGEKLHPVCYDKPLTLGLPAMISNYLTHELCLSVCKELELNAAVLHMNKCYCFISALAYSSILKSSHEKYQKQHCGNPCPGMFKCLMLMLFLGLNHFSRTAELDHIIVAEYSIFDLTLNRS